MGCYCLLKLCAIPKVNIVLFAISVVMGRLGGTVRAPDS